MTAAALNFHPKLQVINADQIAPPHTATLDVLERTGVKITPAGALKILAGANMDVRSTIFCYGPIEMSLMTAALGHMAQHGARSHPLGGAGRPLPAAGPQHAALQAHQVLGHLRAHNLRPVGGGGAKRLEERLQRRTLDKMRHRPAALPAEQLRELDRMQKSWK
jgi:hypothetical protein